ncbi:MAG: helix-turn-helix domain-containing protein [Christensenellales bacterium]
MNIGGKIRELRLHRKMTQSEVVEGYMTRNMLSKIENGSATPSIRTLEHIAQALEVPMGYFVSDEDMKKLPEKVQDFGGYGKKIFRLAQKIEEGSPAVAAAVCIQGYILIARGEAEEARSRLEEIYSDSLTVEEKNMVCIALEDCCKEMEDYRGAYEYATKRIGLGSEAD